MVFTVSQTRDETNTLQLPLAERLGKRI